jgi:hypothetical protein
MLTALEQNEQVQPSKFEVLKRAVNALKLMLLFIFWNYGILITFFMVWVIACYTYFDTVATALLPTKLQNEIMSTPVPGKTAFIIIAGRKVTLKCNCYIKRLKLKFIKGD